MKPTRFPLPLRISGEIDKEGVWDTDAVSEMLCVTESDVLRDSEAVALSLAVTEGEMEPERERESDSEAVSEVDSLAVADALWLATSKHSVAPTPLVYWLGQAVQGQTVDVAVGMGERKYPTGHDTQEDTAPMQKM